MTRAVPSKHGEALGRELAQLADSQVAANPQIRERCAYCAFTAGTMTNKMAPTLLGAMKCVIGADPAHFGCHHGLDDSGQPTKLCAGYLLCRAAPFEEVKSAVARAASALNGLTGTAEDMTDPAFRSWRSENDPDDQLNDYQRSHAFAAYQRQQSRGREL